MFRQLKPNHSDISIFINDEAVPASTGELVAAVLARQGILAVHTSPKNEQRGPYCMMGVCFECMITCEDGRIEQACQIYAEDGLKIYLPVTQQNKAGK